LFSASREVMAVRVLPQKDCAAAARKIVASWAAEGRRPEPRAEVPSVRTPLKVTPPEVLPAPPGPRLEVGASGGLAPLPSPAPYVSVSMGFGPRHGLGFAVDAAYIGPIAVNDGRGVRGTLAPGIALRETVENFAFRIFVTTPVGVVQATQVVTQPLLSRTRTSALAAVDCGLEATAWAARFAPSLSIALDVPLVNSAYFKLAPLSVTLALGFRWSVL
jgi:hypothetical protein